MQETFISWAASILELAPAERHDTTAVTHGRKSVNRSSNWKWTWKSSSSIDF